jgi:hypothetical protein
MQQGIGDLVDIGQGSFAGGRIRVPMSTAIFRTYTSDGFIIATDGRTRGAEDGTIVSDETQKIFPIGGSTPRFLAYSISGMAAIPSLDATEMAFKFIKEINGATQALSSRRYSSLADYTRKAFRAVHQKLEDAKLSGRLDYPEAETLDPSEPGSTIARVFVDGYYKGIPSRVKARFFHQHQVLAGLEVVQQELATGAQWYQGPNKIYDLMFRTYGEGGNPMFSAYERRSGSLVFHPNQTLRIHAQMAHAYISVCSGPEALAIDPKVCAGIGGAIQIAIITPKDGFQWVPGFDGDRLPKGNLV